MKKTLLLMSVFALSANILAMESEVKVDDTEAIIAQLTSKDATIDPSDIVSARYTADNKIVTGHNDHTVRIWNAETGEMLAAIRPARTTVRSATFSADGKTITTTNESGITRTWNVETGEEITK